MGILTTACSDWASGPWAWVPPVKKDRRFAVGLMHYGRNRRDTQRQAAAKRQRTPV